MTAVRAYYIPKEAYQGHQERRLLQKTIPEAASVDHDECQTVRCLSNMEARIVTVETHCLMEPTI